jgi:hypothetical protein
MPSIRSALKRSYAAILHFERRAFAWKRREDRAKRRGSSELKEIGQSTSDEICLSRETLVLTLKNSSAFPGIRSSLFQTCVLLYELLLTVAGEAHSQLR